MAGIPTTGEGTKPIIGVLGEIYVRMTPFANGFLEEEIERLGGEVWIVPLSELIQDLQKEAGPAVYKRDDIHVRGFISKSEMVERLVDAAPDKIAGESVVKVDDYDGVKYHLADDSWLLIRPSGTEPVLRVYAEAGSEAAVDALIQKGRELSIQ